MFLNLQEIRIGKLEGATKAERRRDKWIQERFRSYLRKTEKETITWALFYCYN